MTVAAVVVSVVLGACGRSTNVTQPAPDAVRDRSGSFAVPPPPPKAPVLSLPANGAAAVSVSPKLTWKPPAGAKSYRLQIAPDVGFATLVTDASGLTVTSVVVAGLAEGTQYFWRVSATGSGGAGVFSDPFSFTTTKPGVSPPSTNPCTSLRGLGGDAKPTLAEIPQFRPRRLRLDLTADVAAGTISAMGKCAVSKAPAVQFTSGTGNVFLSGTTTSVTNTGGELTFGPLLVPPLEHGVVVATDVAGNTLEVIWPALAGDPPGPPILRLQLASFDSSVKGSIKVDVTLSFTAKAPDGTTATFTASATNMVIPPLKLDREPVSKQ